MKYALKAAQGFAAGALAVLIFHQSMYFVLSQFNLVQNLPWRMNPIPPFGVPSLINQMFWGGLWGVLYAVAVARWIPGALWIGGLVFGLVFPMTLGSWLIVPLIKSQPLLSGYFIHHDPLRLLSGFLLNGIAYGLGLGIIYSTLGSKK